MNKSISLLALSISAVCGLHTAVSFAQPLSSQNTVGDNSSTILIQGDREGVKTFILEQPLEGMNRGQVQSSALSENIPLDSNKGSTIIHGDSGSESGEFLFGKNENGDIIQEDGEIEEKAVRPRQIWGMSAWAQAVVKKDYTKIAQLLAQHTSSAGAKTSNTIVDNKVFLGNTAAHLAAMQGDASLISMLIDAKADMTVLNDKGESALQLACGYASVNTLKAMVNSAGTTAAPALNKKTKDGRTCAHYTALYNKSPEVAHYLTGLAVDFDATDANGQTAAHYSASTRNWPILLVWLSAKKVNNNLKDNFEQTAQDYLWDKADLFEKEAFLPYFSAQRAQEYKTIYSKIQVVR